MLKRQCQHSALLALTAGATASTHVHHHQTRHNIYRTTGDIAQSKVPEDSETIAHKFKKAEAGRRAAFAKMTTDEKLQHGKDNFFYDREAEQTFGGSSAAEQTADQYSINHYFIVPLAFFVWVCVRMIVDPFGEGHFMMPNQKRSANGIFEERKRKEALDEARGTL